MGECQRIDAFVADWWWHFGAGVAKARTEMETVSGRMIVVYPTVQQALDAGCEHIHVLPGIYAKEAKRG